MADPYLQEAIKARQQVTGNGSVATSVKDLVPAEYPIEPPKTQDVIMKKSAVNPGQRAELASIPTKAGKIAYLTKIAGFKPENIVEDVNGQPGVRDAEKKDLIYPIDPEGFEAGDITELGHKGLVSTAQTIGGLLPAALSLPSGPGAIATGMAGAATTGAATEAALQKYNIEHLKKKYGVDLSPYYSKGEVIKEAALGAGGELISPALKGITSLTKKPTQKIAGEATEQGIKSLKNKAAKTIEKAIPKDPNKIAVSKVLAGNLEDRTVAEVASNPYVRKNIRNMMTKEVDVLGKEAADSVQNVLNNIPKIQSDIYKKAGISNDTLVPIDKAVKGIKTQIDEIIPYATKKDQRLIRFAADQIDDLTKSAKKGKIAFGKLKRITNELYNTADMAANRGDNQAAKWLGDIRKSLVVARNEIPELKGSSAKYAALADNIEELKEMFRLNTAIGETRLENKILSLYKDKGNQTMIQRLKDIAGNLKDIPEAKHLSNFYDKIALANVANDISMKKAVTPVGLGRLPILKYLQNIPGLGDPETKMQVLAKMAESGTISPEKMLGTVQRSNIPVLGDIITGIRARKAIYNKLPGVPNINLKPGIRELLKYGVRKDSVQNSSPISIRELVKEKRQNTANNVNNILGG